MRRVLSLFLPSFSTDRLRRSLGADAPPVERPLVLVGRDGRRRIVMAADRAARNAGLYMGMPATLAQALAPGLILKDAEPAGDLEALECLALWAFRRCSPIVAIDPPGGLVIDTTGADHLHGGEPVMLKSLADGLAALGLTVRAAIADGWGAAHGFARFGASTLTVIPTGTSPQAVLDLPEAALRLSKELDTKLKVLGFDTIDDLASRPRAPLAQRFGPELGRRLDQATGCLDEPIDPIRPPELVEIRRAFAEPIGASDTIARYIAKLALLRRPWPNLQSREIRAQQRPPWKNSVSK